MTQETPTAAQIEAAFRAMPKSVTGLQTAGMKAIISAAMTAARTQARTPDQGWQDIMRARDEFLQAKELSSGIPGGYEIARCMDAIEVLFDAILRTPPPSPVSEQERPKKHSRSCLFPEEICTCDKSSPVSEEASEPPLLSVDEEQAMVDEIARGEHGRPYSEFRADVLAKVASRAPAQGELVERLRQLANEPWFSGGNVQSLCNEAADRIAALEAIIGERQ